MTRVDVLSAVAVEWMKLRRANIFWISVTVAGLFPLLIGLVMTGAVGSDAGIVVEQSPAAYLMQFDIVVAIGGLIGFGFLFSWMFGREFTDGTVTDLLSLPTSRAIIVAAKFVVAALWSAGLAALHFAIGVVLTASAFPGSLSFELLAGALGGHAFTVAMVVFLSIPVAFIAGVGRGYLAPLGFVIVAVAGAQLFTALGWGPYFPWAVPGLAGGVAGESFMNVGALGLSLPFVVGLVGMVATVLWWERADH